ncbi:hypothetical protein EMCRGX_G031871 [Ephydatia muelleri]
MPFFGRKKKAKALDKDSRNQSAESKTEKRASPVISSPLVDTATQSDFPSLPPSSQYTAANGPSASGLQDACDPGYCVITQRGWQEDISAANDTQITVDLAPEGHTQQQVTASKVSNRASPSTVRTDRAEVRATPRETEADLSVLPSLTSLPEGSDDSFFLKTPLDFPPEGSPKQNIVEEGRVYSQVRKKPRSRAQEAFASYGRGRGDTNERRTRKRTDAADEYGRRQPLDFQDGDEDKNHNYELKSSRRGKTLRHKTFPGDHSEDTDDSGEENEVDGGNWSEENLTLSSEVSYNDERERTKPQSSSYPAHRPPSSGKRKKGDSLFPVVQPETIAPLSPLSPYAPPYDAGYVFTKRQPDGSLQYYSATPVMSPTTSTPAAPPASPLLRPSGNMSDQEAFYFPTPPRLSSSWPYLTPPIQNGHPAYGSGQPLAVAPATYRGLGTPQQAAHSQPIFYAPNSTPASSLSNPWQSAWTPFGTPSALPQQPSATPHTPPIGHRVSSPPRPAPRKPRDASGGGGGVSGTQPPGTQDLQPQGEGQFVKREGQAAQDGEEVQTESGALPSNKAQRDACTTDSSKSLGSEIDGKLKCLEQESRSLKEIVLKLTDELSQRSFLSTTPGPTGGKLAEKNDVITNLQKEILQLKDEIARLLKDNQELTTNLRSLEESHTATGEWQELVERTEQVTAENVSLEQQCEAQRERMEEMKKEHLATVSQLNSELSKSRKDRQSIEKELRAQKEAHTQLQEKLNSVVTMATGRVTMEEHREAMEEFQRLVDGLAEKSEEDSRTQGHQLKALQKEKKSLVTKLTDAKAVIVQLEEECASLQKSNRKAQEKIAELQQGLEETRDREVAAHVHLTSVVMQAEKAVAERDTFARIVRYQQKHGEEETMLSGHRSVKAKRQSQLSGDRSGRWPSQGYGENTKGSYQDDLQYLRSLLQQNQSDLAACVGNVN